jgi:hypothetical protein
MDRLVSLLRRILAVPEMVGIAAVLLVPLSFLAQGFRYGLVLALLFAVFSAVSVAFTQHAYFKAVREQLALLDSLYPIAHSSRSYEEFQHASAGHVPKA